MARQFEPPAQKLLHLRVIGVGMLRADAFARDVAGQLMQIQRDGQPLFAAHFAVTLNLKIQCRLRLSNNYRPYSLRR